MADDPRFDPPGGVGNSGAQLLLSVQSEIANRLRLDACLTA